MRNFRSVLLLSVLCAGIGVASSVAAGPPYFFTYSVLGIASCDSTHIEGTVTASYDLPPTTNNLFTSVALNGGTPVENFVTVNPPTYTGPLPFTYPIPTTTPPYVISAAALPASNGAPTGSGVSASYTCNVDGTVTAVFTPIVVPAVTSVPTLTEWGLAALALLMALVTVGLMRRRRAL